MYSVAELNHIAHVMIDGVRTKIDFMPYLNVSAVSINDNVQWRARQMFSQFPTHEWRYGVLESVGRDDRPGLLLGIRDLGVI